jgi:ubiquinone/menaquinone biosynthesis C-methylase UbiE
MENDFPPLARVIEEELIGNLILSRFLYPGYVRSLGLAGHEHVLEYMSGGGLMSRAIGRALAPEGSLTCIETSRYWAEKAQRRLACCPNVACLCGDITAMDLAENRFDTAIVRFALHKTEVQKRIDVVSALARLLRPEGTLHIREPAGPSCGVPLPEIRALMRDAGLREVHAGCTGSWLYGPVCTGMYVKSW